MTRQFKIKKYAQLCECWLYRIALNHLPLRQKFYVCRSFCYAHLMHWLLFFVENKQSVRIAVCRCFFLYFFSAHANNSCTKFILTNMISTLYGYRAKSNVKWIEHTTFIADVYYDSQMHFLLYLLLFFIHSGAIVKNYSTFWAEVVAKIPIQQRWAHL